MLCQKEKESEMPMNDGFLLARFVPINKNHTRVLFRSYGMGFNKLRKMIPFFDDIMALENWRVCTCVHSQFFR